MQRNRWPGEEWIAESRSHAGGRIDDKDEVEFTDCAPVDDRREIFDVVCRLRDDDVGR